MTSWLHAGLFAACGGAMVLLSGCGELKDDLESASKDTDAHVLADELAATSGGKLKGRVQIRNVGAPGDVTVRLEQALLSADGKVTTTAISTRVATTHFNRNETRWVEFEAARPEFTAMLVVVFPSTQGGFNQGGSTFQIHEP